MKFKTLFTLALAFGLTACGGQADSGQNDPKNDTSETAMSDTVDYTQYEFTTITGEPTSLEAFAGKVVLVVNVASQCGFTPQYAGLQDLYQKYSEQGLVVIGFPANNFGNQEPGTNKEIQNFCTSNFGVTFPMMAKVNVKGDDKHPLFVALTEKSHLPGEITWNFNKFLLDREGKLVARYESKVTPMSDELTGAIEKLL